MNHRMLHNRRLVDLSTCLVSLWLFTPFCHGYQIAEYRTPSTDSRHFTTSTIVIVSLSALMSTVTALMLCLQICDMSRIRRALTSMKGHSTPPASSDSNLSPRRFRNTEDIDDGPTPHHYPHQHHHSPHQHHNRRAQYAGGGRDSTEMGTKGLSSVPPAPPPALPLALSQAPPSPPSGELEEKAVYRHTSNMQRHNIDMDTTNMNDIQMNQLLSRLCHTTNFDRSTLHYTQQIACGWFGLVLLSELVTARGSPEHQPRQRDREETGGGEVERGGASHGDRKETGGGEAGRGGASLNDREETGGGDDRLVAVCSLNNMQPLYDSITFISDNSRNISHDNVLKFYGLSTEHLPFLKVLEYCELGNAKSYLIRNSTKKTQLLKMCRDFLAGIEALHTAECVHGDLSARNCLLTSDLVLKIGDYGDARETFQEDYYEHIPIRWLPPEGYSYCIDTNLLKPLRVLKSSNIWSIGITIWELLSQCKRQPFSDLTNRQVIKDYQKRVEDVPSEYHHQVYIQDLIRQCCKKEVLRRASHRQLRSGLELLRNSNDVYGVDGDDGGNVVDGGNGGDVDAELFSSKWCQVFPYSMVDIVRRVESSATYDSSFEHSETRDCQSMKSFSNALTLTYDIDV